MPYKDREMRRTSGRSRWARYRARHPERVAAVETRRVAELRGAILAEKLRRGKCSNPDCPLGGLLITPDNAAAFDFDHRDRSEKRGEIGKVRGRVTVVQEMAKCDLLCAFCHRLKTASAGEYWPVLVGDAFCHVPHPTLFDN